MKYYKKPVIVGISLLCGAISLFAGTAGISFSGWCLSIAILYCLFGE